MLGWLSFAKAILSLQTGFAVLEAAESPPYITIQLFWRNWRSLSSR
jgi:hypothetical protein